MTKKITKTTSALAMGTTAILLAGTAFAQTATQPPPVPATTPTQPASVPATTPTQPAPVPATTPTQPATSDASRYAGIADIIVGPKSPGQQEAAGVVRVRPKIQLGSDRPANVSQPSRYSCQRGCRRNSKYKRRSAG